MPKLSFFRKENLLNKKKKGGEEGEKKGGREKVLSSESSSLTSFTLSTCRGEWALLFWKEKKGRGGEYPALIYQYNYLFAIFILLFFVWGGGRASLLPIINNLKNRKLSRVLWGRVGRRGGREKNMSLSICHKFVPCRLFQRMKWEGERKGGGGKSRPFIQWPSYGIKEGKKGKRKGKSKGN